MRQRERTLIKEVVSIKPNRDMKVRVRLIFASAAPIFGHVGVNFFYMLLVILMTSKYLDVSSIC